MMDDKEKTLLLTKLQTLSGRTRDVYKCYYILTHSNLENFQPNFECDLDKRLINCIFSKMITAMFSEYTVSHQYYYNLLFCLSEFKHRISKINRSISHFINIELVPHFTNDQLYMKISIAGKIRYYLFDTKNFKEIKSETYNTMFERKFSTTENQIKFLPLSEME